MKNFLFLLALSAGLVSTTACGGEDDDDIATPDACDQIISNGRIDNVLGEFRSSASAYANEPTTENCEWYRRAAKEYIDVLEEYEHCVDLANDPDYQESLREAQMEFDGLSC